METLKALILTIILLNLASKGLSFYYTSIFAGLFKIYAIYKTRLDLNLLFHLEHILYWISH